MQEIESKRPTDYDWSRMSDRLRSKGVPSVYRWCRDNHYADGGEYSYKTVMALIRGEYVSGAGPKIRAIITQALKDGLIFEIERRQEERRHAV